MTREETLHTPRKATSLADRRIPSSQHRAGTSASTLQHSKRNKQRPQRRSSKFRLQKTLFGRHQLISALSVLFVLGFYGLHPTASNPASRFVFPSYYGEEHPPLDGDSNSNGKNTGRAEDSLYGKGLWDLAFVSFYTLVLLSARIAACEHVLGPLARWCGIRSRQKQMRFTEQTFTALYFAVMGPCGLYVMRQTPVWYFDTYAMYDGFPHRRLGGEFKCYYLVQAAYWAQEAVVMYLGMEKRRKDFKELVTHHVVTLALIGLSYRFHFTYIGIAVYVTHDLSDLLLSIAKSLNYIGSDLDVPVFLAAIAAWTYCRHYLNLRILYSVATEFRTVGPYKLDWQTEQYKCWISNIITFSLLAILQLLNLFWLYCLLRNAVKAVVYKTKKDDRSEAEDSDLDGPDESLSEKLHNK